MESIFTTRTRTENGRKLHEVIDGAGRIWGWAFNRDMAEITREQLVTRVMESIAEDGEFHLQIIPA